jgi:ADP-ribosylglycohydrolase
MLGALVGDIVGSVYEWHNIKTKNFAFFSENCFFTDDSVLTVALADSLITGEPYVQNLKTYYRRYPDAGYGGRFHQWAQSPNPQPYHSWGNGAAMRISPVGFAFDTLETVLEQAQAFTEITHNHPEGIKGGQATAAAIFLARTGSTKEQIRTHVETRFGYDLSRHTDEIRPTYTFNESCQETVPQAICAFLDSTDFEDAIRTAISLGGDSDTLACITGGIAQAFYGGVPDWIARRVVEILDEPLGKVTHQFMEKYCIL